MSRSCRSYGTGGFDGTHPTRHLDAIRAEELELAADFIDLDSPLAAARLIDRADERAASLALFAERGRRVGASGRGEIREVFVGPFRMIYRVGDDVVVMVIRAFVHGARDWRP